MTAKHTYALSDTPYHVSVTIGTGEVRPTQRYNGYGDWVAHLIPGVKPVAKVSIMRVWLPQR